jgi:hypothetical protein
MKSMYDRKKSTCLSLPDNPKPGFLTTPVAPR